MVIITLVKDSVNLSRWLNPVGISVGNKPFYYGKSPPVNTEKQVSLATQNFLPECLSSVFVPH